MSGSIEHVSAPSAPERGWKVRLFELAVTVPIVAFLAWSVARDPSAFVSAEAFVWAGALALTGLLPATRVSTMGFTLRVPLELSAALLFAPPVAAAVAFVGSTSRRELRGHEPPLAALFDRSRAAACVLAEATVIARAIDRDLTGGLWNVLAGVPAWSLVVPMLIAAAVGYLTNLALLVPERHLRTGAPVRSTLRELHAGEFGAFVGSYMALALFALIVAAAVPSLGPFAILIFVPPLAFTHQLLTRTHALREASEELATEHAKHAHLATHDPLTDLPNRVRFQEHLAATIAAAQRDGSSIGVMLMDLDHFKEINDTLGHHVGDLLLREIGPRLAGSLRDHDLLARLGGDEFGVVLPGLGDEGLALQIASRLLRELEEPVTVEGLALDVSGSIGIALLPDHANDAESLMRRADVAMYAAKERGSGCELYREAFDRQNPRRLTLIGQVRPALDAGEFTVHYQPKVRLADGHVCGAEALVRWEHPTMGLVAPGEFIPLVEKTVLLRPLTRYVIEDVLRQWSEWANMGIRLPISVNLSPRSLPDGELPDLIAELLQRHEVPPAYLRLELTAGALTADSGRSTIVLDRLADLGVGLSLDDFGIGYSSLLHLKRLPIEEIKVDRSFVTQMPVDANDFMIVRAIVDLGRNLGLRVVAEGVEERTAFERLTEFGCDEAQGYFISKPLSAVEFTRWLSVRNMGLEAPPKADEASGPGRLHAV